MIVSFDKLKSVCKHREEDNEDEWCAHEDNLKHNNYCSCKEELCPLNQFASFRIAMTSIGFSSSFNNVIEMARKAAQEAAERMQEQSLKMPEVVIMEPAQAWKEMLDRLERDAHNDYLEYVADLDYGYDHREEYFDKLNYIRPKNHKVNTRGYAQGNYHRSRDRLRRIK